jgi:hypothetical protein
MPRIQVYSNLPMAFGGTLQGPGPLGVPATTVVATNCIPCKGAKMAVARLVSTDANAWANLNLWVSNNPDRRVAGSIFAAPAAAYSLRSPGTAVANVGGITVALEMVNPGSTFWHDFIQLWATAHATQAHTAVQVSVEVHYDADSYYMLREANQHVGLPMAV